ncbi:hypothetical protein Q8F55_005559 [Vanrija albida]|uniref:Uncharacterized protein n=1 Tax=Vanrija albida TaxID=181172 RepID=A0ABR3Q1Z8_9TREE
MAAHYPTSSPTFPPSPSTAQYPMFAATPSGAHPHGSPFTPGFPSRTPTPPLSSNRKRRAGSPPAEGQPGPSNWATSPLPSPGLHDSKRRRPNLANGFSAMSISQQATPSPSPLPRGPVQQNQSDADDDELLEPTQPPVDGDVAVEVLPDGSPTSSRHASRPPWHRTASFSSTSPSEDDYDSDATFRLPQEKARRRTATPMRPSEVEHPVETVALRGHARQPSSGHGPKVEYFDTPIKRKKRSSPDEPKPKRRKEGMDVDLDHLPPESYGPGWYEPEKDRIVVTSLSSPESSPPPPSRRGSSPTKEQPYYDYETNKQLSQPGTSGFTISPSLLTHIINAQRDQIVGGGFQDSPSQERGLVLYRPLGIPAAEDVVKEWSRGSGPQPKHQFPDPDGDRFEEVDDDEDMSAEQPVVGVPVDAGMDVEGGGGFGYQPYPQAYPQADSPWGHGDDEMDMD